MKRKTELIIIGLVLVALITGSGFLYNMLTQNRTPGNLTVTRQTAAPTETAAPEQTPGAEETPDAAPTPQPETNAAAEQTPPPETLALNFTALDMDGNSVELFDFVGKPIVLNFWASWCPPCKSEMPHFEAAHQKYQGKVQFLMVDLVDGSRETVESGKAYIQEQGFTFPVLFDDGQQAGMLYGIRSIPTTFFLDEEGNIAAYAQGAMDAASLENGIGMIYAP